MESRRNDADGELRIRYVHGMKIFELNHVALMVRDVEKSCAFYSEVLRLEKISRPAFDFPGAWFRLGTEQELHLIGGRTEVVTQMNRANHFALRTDELTGWQEHFKRLAIEFRGPKPRPDGAMQIFLHDVDGHLIELFTPSDA